MKKWFPISGMATNVVGLVVSLIIYAALSAVFAWLQNLLDFFFLFEIIGSALLTIVGVYSLIGAIIAVVTFIKSRD